MDPELHILKREKNALLQEVARLKQEHRQTIAHMSTLNQRLESAEDRQKQVVSFLAKLLRNPAFLRQLTMLREHKEIESSRVKRKFLKHAPHGSTDSGESSSPHTGESGSEIPASSPAPPCAHDAIADLQSFLLEDTDLSDGMLPGNFGLDGVEAPGDVGALVQAFNTQQDGLDFGTGAELLGTASGAAHCQDPTIGRSKGKNVLCPGLDGATSSEAECLVSLPDNMGMIPGTVLETAGKLMDADDEQIWGVDPYLQSSCCDTRQQAYGSGASDPYLMEIANKPEKFWELDFEDLDDGDLHLDKCVIGDPALQQQRGNMKP